jgi:hypothetical protein
MPSKVDAKRRVVIPGARPGEIFDVQKLEEGRILLVRLERPEASPRRTRRECLAAMDEASLTPGMSWKELKTLTRDS